ncbi:hypothetical protein ESCO_004211 [Escovopsis weberi]|uniref:LYC1 C-terminal domain-containing protein n=1 Tax=Escovopsis weberi TaxID=150374 RepID=A0A0M8MXR3_ESCWE|nr:hypothetical protein ESCO_004211 [Escovopsis weberi]
MDQTTKGQALGEQTPVDRMIEEPEDQTPVIQAPEDQIPGEIAPSDQALRDRIFEDQTFEDQTSEDQTPIPTPDGTPEDQTPVGKSGLEGGLAYTTPLDQLLLDRTFVDRIPSEQKPGNQAPPGQLPADQRPIDEILTLNDQSQHLLGFKRVRNRRAIQEALRYDVHNLTIPLGLSQSRDLQGHDLIRGKIAWWVLYFREDRSVVSSCATQLRDAIMSTPTGVKTVKAAVITQIFTVPSHRLQGMATRLLRCVHTALDEMEGTRVMFSVAYGCDYAPFFQRLGFQPYRADELRIVLGPSTRADAPSGKSEQAGDFPHEDPENVKSVPGQDEGQPETTSGVDPEPPSSQPESEVLYTSMSYEVASMLIHHDDRESTAGEPAGDDPDEGTQRRGWYLENSFSRNFVAIWWIHDFEARKLYLGNLVRSRLLEFGSISAVLQTAVEEAKRHGLGEVVMWNPSSDVVCEAERLASGTAGELTAVVERRTNSVPYLRWREGENRNVKWEHIQYEGFAW